MMSMIQTNKGKNFDRLFKFFSTFLTFGLSLSDIGSKHTDILVNVNFTCIWCCPIFLISHQIHGTPNTCFFMCFSKIRRKEKRVFGVEQSLPIKLHVIGVLGKSKSCLRLGYTEACGTIRCHLKNFWCFLLEHFPSFFSVSQ